MESEFLLDRDLIPEVTFYEGWPLKMGDEENLYKSGEWTFSLYDDNSPEDALKGAYAWIAWYEFLIKERSKQENPS
jgi:hypothetical protein